VSALRDWTAFFVDVGQWTVTVVTAADTVTPDASFTSPLLAIDKHFRGLLNGEHAMIRDE
jgi:hypothetical protein